MFKKKRRILDVDLSQADVPIDIASSEEFDDSM